MDDNDLDLGSTGPVIDRGRFVISVGKSGFVYVLDINNLGGAGGSLSTGRPAVSSSAITRIAGALSVFTTNHGTYIAAPSHGKVVTCFLAIYEMIGDPPSPTFRWCAPGSYGDLGSPIVTTTDGTSNAIVWGANERLYGFDGETGEVLVDGSKTVISDNTDFMHYFNSPIDANGRIVVATYGYPLTSNSSGNAQLVFFQ
jgi:hypothetical protein